MLPCSDEDAENDPSRQVDDADEEDDGEREAKWRTERLEREKFLEEHKVDTTLLHTGTLTRLGDWKGIWLIKSLAPCNLKGSTFRDHLGILPYLE